MISDSVTQKSKWTARSSCKAKPFNESDLRAMVVPAFEPRPSEYHQSSRPGAHPSFKSFWPHEKLQFCVTGAGGFIASHLARRLKAEGHYVVCADWKRIQFLPVIGHSSAERVPVAVCMSMNDNIARIILVRCAYLFVSQYLSYPLNLLEYRRASFATNSALLTFAYTIIANQLSKDVIIFSIWPPTWVVSFFNLSGPLRLRSEKASSAIKLAHMSL